jgi:hypothetical protein
MKRVCLFLFLIILHHNLFAQNELGPDGDKLLWVLLIILVTVLVLAVIGKTSGKNREPGKKSFFRYERVTVELEKDRVYYPDNLQLTIKNKGNSDIDLDRPLLVFDNFWLKRKFRLKGFANYSFYPLFLEKGKTHTLPIDLNRFYSHDKSLKKFPKTKVVVYNVKGKKLGSTSVFLRKTLFKF